MENVSEEPDYTSVVKMNSQSHNHPNMVTFYVYDGLHTNMTCNHLGPCD